MMRPPSGKAESVLLDRWSSYTVESQKGSNNRSLLKTIFLIGGLSIKVIFLTGSTVFYIEEIQKTLEFFSR